MEFEKPTMGTAFIVGGFIILAFINAKGIDPSGILTTISGIFLTFPLLLLTIFVISSLRKSIKKSYKAERDFRNKDIQKLREKQKNKKLTIGELIVIDETGLSP
jgi:amino acid transporter